MVVANKKTKFETIFRRLLSEELFCLNALEYAFTNPNKSCEPLFNKIRNPKETTK